VRKTTQLRDWIESQLGPMKIQSDETKASGRINKALEGVCQQDESVYGYEQIDGRWRRIWESEQDNQAWSLPGDLSGWHPKRHAGFASGDFPGPTMHCQTPDLWQVGFEPQDAGRNFAPEPNVYFLIRWTPPYRSALVDISHNPWPGCTQADPEADAWRTLFSTQD